MHDLIHINEALAGLPVEVGFVSFEDVKKGALKDYDVVINAGKAGTAWSGGDAWKDGKLVTTLQKWVYEGGIFLGVNEPSAVEGYSRYFRMGDVLGIDLDTGARVCHGGWEFETDQEMADALIPEGAQITGKKGLYLTDGKAKVLAERDGVPVLTVNNFGEGYGIYLSNLAFNDENTRLLLNLLLLKAGGTKDQKYLTDNTKTECAYYPASGRLVVINNSEEPQEASVKTETDVIKVSLMPFETIILEA
jgi:beta-D-galactosyl-(1->4)-L-rhamnose phosphorylase